MVKRRQEDIYKIFSRYSLYCDNIILLYNNNVEISTQYYVIFSQYHSAIREVTAKFLNWRIFFFRNVLKFTYSLFIFVVPVAKHKQLSHEPIRFLDCCATLSFHEKLITIILRENVKWQRWRKVTGTTKMNRLQTVLT